MTVGYQCFEHNSQKASKVISSSTSKYDTNTPSQLHDNAPISPSSPVCDTDIGLADTVPNSPVNESSPVSDAPGSLSYELADRCSNATNSPRFELNSELADPTLGLLSYGRIFQLDTAPSSPVENYDSANSSDCDMIIDQIYSHKRYFYINNLCRDILKSLGPYGSVYQIKLLANDGFLEVPVLIDCSGVESEKKLCQSSSCMLCMYCSDKFCPTPFKRAVPVCYSCQQVGHKCLTPESFHISGHKIELKDTPISNVVDLIMTQTPTLEEVCEAEKKLFSIVAPSKTILPYSSASKHASAYIHSTIIVDNMAEMPVTSDDCLADPVILAPT
ncbi:hypothetical protein BDB01DRAFT_832601 [Pilobolus umbonatus]|nr:hypothetical protein BDB01DRAFT_832601 [Pilobolus umbonatus]